MIRRVNLGVRLATGFGLLAVIIIIQSMIALGNMSKIQDSQNDLSINWLPSVIAVEKLRFTMIRYRVFTLRLILDASPNVVTQTETKLAAIGKEVDAAFEEYRMLMSEEREREIFPNLIRNRDQYIANTQSIEKLVESGDISKAKDVIEFKQNPLADLITRDLADLEEINTDGAHASVRLATEVYNHSTIIIYITIALSLVITGALAYVVTRSITIPIHDALTATERVASGNLSHRIDSIGNDEPARLIGGIAIMQDNLRQTISEIATSSSQLATATARLTNVAADANISLQRQNDEVQQAATAVTEMSAAVDEVARNATSTSEASNMSSALAKEGRERVRQTVAAIQSMSHEVTNTSSLVESLAEKSQQIGKVLDVIRAIAEQTNLLALNAAIEAARAGEMGRGFAVVADEVRGLAHRTQVSTKEIEGMIRSVQEGSNFAVISMRQSTAHTKETLDIAQEAGIALDQITEQSSTISDRNVLIASASEEQAQVAREVDRNIINISNLSTQSADGVSKTSASAQELSALTVSLNNLVGRFVL